MPLDLCRLSLELHRVLKPTGSLYLHCDPTASHYLKLLLDGVFGATNFRNEIIWKRTTPKGLAFSRFASNHDVILVSQHGNMSSADTQRYGVGRVTEWKKLLRRG